jgi:PAS domain S-box-containing protein
VATDPDMKVTSLNRGAEEKFGWHRQEAIGKPWAEVAPGRILKAELPHVLRTLAETDHWRGELVHSCRDGAETFSNVTAITLRDQAGQITGYVTVSRHFTEQKPAQERIAYQATLLENVNDAILTYDTDLRVTS